MIEQIAKIVMCHIVGDYLFQTDYMAMEKGKDWYILFVHCVCYCVPFAIVFGIDYRLMLIFISHIVADALKARWHMIGLVEDQLFHYEIAIILLLR